MSKIDPRPRIVDVQTERLREHREKQGLSQEAVAELIGTSRVNYCAYETGRKQIGPKVLLKIAKALDLDPSQLLDQKSLRALRHLSGLRQKEVANQLGFASGTTWGQIERGERPLPSELVKATAAVLGVASTEVEDAQKVTLGAIKKN